MLSVWSRHLDDATIIAGKVAGKLMGMSASVRRGMCYKESLTVSLLVSVLIILKRKYSIIVTPLMLGGRSEIIANCGTNIVLLDLLGLNVSSLVRQNATRTSFDYDYRSQVNFSIIFMYYV